MVQVVTYCITCLSIYLSLKLSDYETCPELRSKQTAPTKAKQRNEEFLVLLYSGFLTQKSHQACIQLGEEETQDTHTMVVYLETAN